MAFPDVARTPQLARLARLTIDGVTPSDEVHVSVADRLSHCRPRPEAAPMPVPPRSGHCALNATDLGAHPVSGVASVWTETQWGEWLPDAALCLLMIVAEREGLRTARLDARLRAHGGVAPCGLQSAPWLPLPTYGPDELAAEVSGPDGAARQEQLLLRIRQDTAQRLHEMRRLDRVSDLLGLAPVLTLADLLHLMVAADVVRRRGCRDDAYLVVNSDCPTPETLLRCRGGAGFG